MLTPPCLLQAELGKGSFQELDQVAAVRRFTKFARQAKRTQDIAPIIEAAVKVHFAHCACLLMQTKSLEKITI